MWSFLCAWGRKIKAIKDNFQKKVLVHFAWRSGAFQICIYTDIITITAKSCTKEKKYFLLLTKGFQQGSDEGWNYFETYTVNNESWIKEQLELSERLREQTRIWFRTYVLSCFTSESHRSRTASFYFKGTAVNQSLTVLSSFYKAPFYVPVKVQWIRNRW